jgi:hypothetical protein
MSLDVPFSCATVFFSALQSLDPNHATMSEESWHAACRALPSLDIGSVDIDDMLSAVINRATQEHRLVRPFDILLAAASTGESTVSLCLASVGDTIAGVLQRLTDLCAPEASTDEPPPMIAHDAPRFALVVQGPDFYSAGNTYATFEEAQRACAHLRARVFGEEMPSFPNTVGYVTVFPPPRFRQATAIYIREL